MTFGDLIYFCANVCAENNILIEDFELNLSINGQIHKLSKNNLILYQEAGNPIIKGANISLQIDTKIEENGIDFEKLKDECKHHFLFVSGDSNPKCSMCDEYYENIKKRQ